MSVKNYELMCQSFRDAKKLIDLGFPHRAQNLITSLPEHVYERALDLYETRKPRIPQKRWFRYLTPWPRSTDRTTLRIDPRRYLPLRKSVYEAYELCYLYYLIKLVLDVFETLSTYTTKKYQTKDINNYQKKLQKYAVAQF